MQEHICSAQGIEDVALFSSEGGCCVQDRIGTGSAASLFAKEFVAGINRIQYNQGNGINALAGVLATALASLLTFPPNSS